MVERNNPNKIVEKKANAKHQVVKTKAHKGGAFVLFNTLPKQYF